MKRVFLSIVVILLIASTGKLYAGKHPVPLEKDIDAAKCLECHEDKSKGKFVHSAIATGCTSCHEVRVNKDVTRVKLTTTTPQALCLTCHADKNAADIKGTVHAPAVRDCIKCHDPHTAENKNQLLKADMGDKTTNLCLSCHKTGLDVPAEGSRHAALDMGCSTCHITHKTGEAGKREFDFHLTKDAPALCVDCHDPKDDTIAKAHNGQPIAKADCLTCHDPHQSNGKKLVQRFVHAPFSDKDSCATCHEAPKDGKVVLTQAEPKALCVTCHEEQAKKIETAKVQHPGAMGNCTDCHNAHAGKSQGFPKPDAVNACLACHADQAEQHKKKHLHQPAFEQGCATCHEPHGGDNVHLLRAKTTSALCIECHGPDAKPQKLEKEHLVTIFDGKVRLPENYFAKVARLPIKYGLGHPVEKHPVVDQMDPTDVTKLRVAINCATCHQPHASAQPGLLVNDQANNIAFCASCHKDLGK
ncbi:MAG TPA: cytochrome c3 family protein [Clostridia bacterium]|nr:cytochrome c3 family protein [Clostridia bacterium]